VNFDEFIQEFATEETKAKINKEEEGKIDE
jgi:hypothetical protein